MEIVRAIFHVLACRENTQMDMVWLFNGRRCRGEIYLRARAGSKHFFELEKHLGSSNLATIHGLAVYFPSILSTDMRNDYI